MGGAAILLGYCLSIFVASYLGGWLPGRWNWTHTRLQLVMSFVAGLMLGVALLHLLPHAAAESGSLDSAVAATLVGLLVMFFLIRMFHFHQHAAPEDIDKTDGGQRACLDHGDHDHDHGQLHDAGQRPDYPGTPHHGHGPGCDHHHGVAPYADHDVRLGHRFGWVGLFLGLALHTLIDGMALGASVAADAHHEHAIVLAGFGTFLAVVLHKPLDALSITTLMMASGWTVRRQRIVNAAFGLICPLGAGVFWFGSTLLADHSHLWLGLALGFSAGVFLCISLGDLLPEVHFHSHDRFKLSACLLAGILLAYGVGFLEPRDAHKSHAHDAHDAHDAPSHVHER